MALHNHTPTQRKKIRMSLRQGKSMPTKKKKKARRTAPGGY